MSTRATEKKLGKIEWVSFGIGGYQDAMLGLSVTLSGGSWVVGDFKGFWSQTIKCTTHSKWTEADRSAAYADTARFVDDLLRKAKKTDVAKLVGVPVEVEFDGMSLRSWRVLEEVL